MNCKNCSHSKYSHAQEIGGCSLCNCLAFEPEEAPPAEKQSPTPPEEVKDVVTTTDKVEASVSAPAGEAEEPAAGGESVES